VTLAHANDVAHRSALVIAAEDASVVMLRGSDRWTWLAGMVTCEVSEKQAVYGLLVSKKGRITSDLTIVPGRDEVAIVLPARAKNEVLAVFDHHVVMEDVEVVVTEKRVYFAHGPRAREIEIPNAIVCEIDTTGLGGAVIITEGDAREALNSAVSAIGGSVGTDADWEALRIEQGVPRFGKDFDDSTYPQEASLEKRAVSFDKGCYLGQEVVCMLELRGHVKRKLVPVLLSKTLAPGTKLFDEKGLEIGQITSAAGDFGLAMVKLAHAKTKTVLQAGDAAVTVR